MHFIKFDIIFNVIFIYSIESTALDLAFNTIVAFGDSQTDTGNVYNLTQHNWPLVPPYYEGRFSNNRVWVEKVGISNLINFAFGDATIDNINFIKGYTGPNQTLIPSIRQQIVSYLSIFDMGKVDTAHTLYIIWASGNEYLINMSLPASVVVNYLLKAVTDLIISEAKNIIVVNLPPLQYLPGVNKNDYNLATLVVDHNSFLLGNVTRIQSENPNRFLRVFDVNSVITDILSNNTKYTSFNKVDKCWNISNNTVVSQCQNASEYVFIDDYHFTSVIHGIIANNFLQFILSSIPNSSTSSKFSIFLIMILSIVNKFISL